VPDLAGLQVLHDGQPVGRTDSEGRILVPALRAFEDNTITVVPEDLPPGAMVDSERIVVRLYSHGVVAAVLDVSATDSAVFVLRIGDADFVPAGAAVAVGGHVFPVGSEGVAQLPVGRGGVACGGVPRGAWALLQTCDVSAVGVNFGVYNPLSVTATTATGTVSLSCTLGLFSSWTVGLSAGSSGSFAQRVLGGAGSLAYNWYTSAAYSSVWGDGSGGT